jgi:hypothetical protein
MCYGVFTGKLAMAHWYVRFVAPCIRDSMITCLFIDF